MTAEEFKQKLEAFKKECIEAVKSTAKEQGEQAENKLKEYENGLDKKIEEAVGKFKSSRRVSLPGVEEEIKKEPFHWSGLIEAQVTGEWAKDCAREKEIIEQTAKAVNGEGLQRSEERNKAAALISKSLNVGSGASGGFLVPEEASSEVIDLVIANRPLFQLQPDVMRGLRGDLPMPKVTQRPTGYWVDEEEAPAESSIKTGEIIMRPFGLAAFSKISNRLLHQSRRLADRIARNEIVKAIGLKMEQDVFEGSVGSKKPLSIINFPDLTASTAIGVNGGRFRVDNAADMMAQVEEANLDASTKNPGFVMRPMVLSGMKRERVPQFSGQAEAEGMPVINPLVSTQVLEGLLNAKIRTTTLLDNTLTKGTGTTLSRVIFGLWDELMIGFWEGMELRASDSAGNSGGSAFLQRQIWLLAFQDVDIKAKHDEAFSVISDAQSVSSKW